MKKQLFILLILGLIGNNIFPMYARRGEKEKEQFQNCIHKHPLFTEYLREKKLDEVLTERYAEGKNILAVYWDAQNFSLSQEWDKAGQDLMIYTLTQMYADCDKNNKL